MIASVPGIVSSKIHLHTAINKYCLFLNFSAKIEKEKRELAKQYGMVRTEVAGGEIAEEMEKERRMFQLHMCEVSGADEKVLLPFVSCVDQSA